MTRNDVEQGQNRYHVLCASVPARQLMSHEQAKPKLVTSVCYKCTWSLKGLVSFSKLQNTHIQGFDALESSFICTHISCETDLPPTFLPPVCVWFSHSRLSLRVFGVNMNSMHDV